MEHWPIV